MTPPPLADHLNRLADQLAAPPTADTRQAIGRRATRLRRRRRVRGAVGGGLLALLVIAGARALQVDDPADVETDVAGPSGDTVPALTANLDGWRVSAAEDATATPDAAGDVAGPDPESLQVFRRPGDLVGPSIFLHHRVASDAIAAAADAAVVDVRGSQGFLEQNGPDSFTLSWDPQLNDSQADLEARGITRDQVLAFASGVQGKDDNITYPPDPGDKLGFVPGPLPKGMEEDPVEPTSGDQGVVRRLTLERAPGAIEVTIDDGGELTFETCLGGLLASGGAPEEVSVMGHPAVLVEHPDHAGWSLVWRPTDGATATASLSNVDRSTVDEFIGGLEEISEGEWQELVAATPAPAATGSTIARP
ncbi:MAG TPA: hypothetical protein VKD21_14275 [Acidimicrobiales bacterium]|nr:hypothetical protein [Acidimicrobiales bacterium]